MKVKAHGTQADVDAGRVTELDRTGNRWADAMAKQGARKHPCSKDAELRCLRANQAVGKVGRWIGAVVTHLGRSGNSLADVHPKSERPQPAAHRNLQRQAVRGSNGHTLQAAGSQFFCSVCLRTSQSRSALLRQKCKGSRGVERLAHASHRLFRSGHVWWCNVCGCYGSQRIVGLRGPCPGGARANTGPLKLLRLGMHPVSKARLPSAAPGRVVANAGSS